MTGCDDDSWMFLPQIKIKPGDPLKINTVMGQERIISRNRKFELVLIGTAPSAGFQGGHGAKPPGTHQDGKHDIDIFVKV